MGHMKNYLLITLLLAMTGVRAWGDTWEDTVNHLRYTYNPANVPAGASVKGLGSSGALVIPSSVTIGDVDYAVTSIAGTEERDGRSMWGN